MLCYKSVIRSAVAIIENHKLVTASLVAHDLLPCLLDQTDGLVFEREVKVWGREAVNMG